MPMLTAFVRTDRSVAAARSRSMPPGTWRSRARCSSLRSPTSRPGSGSPAAPSPTSPARRRTLPLGRGLDPDGSSVRHRPSVFAILVSPDHVRRNRKALEILGPNSPRDEPPTVGERVTPQPTLGRAETSLLSIGHSHRPHDIAGSSAASSSSAARESASLLRPVPSLGALSFRACGQRTSPG